MEPGEQDGEIYLKRIMPSPLGKVAVSRMRGELAVIARKRVAAQTRPSSVTFGDSFPEGKPFVLYILHKTTLHFGE